MPTNNRTEHRPKEFLVGVNYFAGWWRDLPNKYVVDGLDWRSTYPERVALLGCFNDQETMDHEIVAASEHAVDFFLMLWYPPEGVEEPYVERLNYGILQFLRSSENHRMFFAVEFCNHPPFAITDPILWDHHCEEWVQWMLHPSYLRIGGKPVFKIHSLRYLLSQCSNSVELASRQIRRLRDIARVNGLSLLIAGGVTAFEPYDNAIRTLAGTVDFLASYMDVPKADNSHDHPYEHLVDFAELGWMHHEHEGVAPYMPYLPAGWNPKPWHDPRPSYIFPNDSQWTAALRRIKMALNRYPRLRVPNETPQGQKMFNIYAWNEFGEGGIVAPTTGDRWMKLEALRTVFGDD
ncbi:MAG: hypothetical protein OWU33_09675 [Firmicutes bacterium]|nr:hypothetical protein [Bacillota bacterium]